MKSLLTCLAVLFVCSGAEAKPKPTFRLIAATGMVTIFPEGQPTFVPLPLVLNLATNIPLSPSWGLNIGLGFKTALSAFNPAPQLVVGPSFQITKRLSLACILLYRYTPDYGKGDNHLLALTVGPGIAITPEISIALGAGPGATLTSGPPILEFDIVPNIAFKLW